LATASGYWPLFRFNPTMRKVGENPFRLDSPRPTIPLKEYAYNEIRYSSLAATRPEEARRLMEAAQNWVDEKYRVYEDMAARDGSRFINEPPAAALTAHSTARGGKA
jgi:pyruvate-ferredoxin/flavodoxin oxidoreductase